jgi:hypothetical protein
MSIQKKPKKIGGPFLAAAVFCEASIEDKKDSSMSAIRIVDQTNILIDPTAPPDFPSEANRIPIALHALFSFKTGDAAGGDHKLRLVMESPSGKLTPIMEKDIPFTPSANGGANMQLNLPVAVSAGGLFLLHVFLDGKRMTKMPYYVSITRGAPQGVNPAPAQPTDGKPSPKKRPPR